MPSSPGSVVEREFWDTFLTRFHPVAELGLGTEEDLFREGGRADDEVKDVILGVELGGDLTNAGLKEVGQGE